MSGSGSSSSAMGPPPKPPPRVQGTSALKSGFAALAANSERIKAIRQEALESKYFDSSSPSTQKRRARARTGFEEYVEAVYQITEIEDIWNSATFVQRSKEFFGAVAQLAVGHLNKNIKAGTLWQHKHGLYWWASALMPDFNIIWQKWHEEVSRHIHFIAVNHGLSTDAYAKNNLSDAELALIFRYIMEQDYGVANLKQHWAAMLLAWVTASRPGSFTVSKGYRKGASLGVPGKVRLRDETLRFEDLEFTRMEIGKQASDQTPFSKNFANFGIAVKVKFRYHKGYRNPHKEKAAVDSSRTFTMLPSRGERFEFDLSLVLLALAFERGLFGDRSLEDLMTGDEREIPVDPVVNKQAVFVAATKAGTLDVDQPMQQAALNEKLAALCTSIGLTQRNTYYSFRRSAIIETRRRHGTEAAKDIALHKPDANSLFFYDNVGMGDVDVTAMRLQEEPSMSREDVRDFYAQYKTRITETPESIAGIAQADLKASVQNEVKHRLRHDKEYVAGEVTHAELLDEGSNKLAELQEAGNIPDTVAIPWGYSAHKSVKIIELLSQYGENEQAQKVRDAVTRRRNLLQRIRRRLQKQVIEDRGAEHRTLLKKSASSAKQVVSSKGKQPKNVREAGSVDLGDSTNAALDALASVADDDDDAEAESEDEDVDEDALEEMDSADARQEPESWEELPDDVQIQLGSKEACEQPESPESAARRFAFLKKLVDKCDSEVPQSGLHCPLCLADPTMSEKEKSAEYSVSRLNNHLTTATHSRASQLKRALKAENTVYPVMCPGCSFPLSDARTAFKHIDAAHKEQLWEDFEEFEAEGGDDNEDDDEDDDDGFAQPPSYVGKGKGRA